MTKACNVVNVYQIINTYSIIYAIQFNQKELIVIRLHINAIPVKRDVLNAIKIIFAKSVISIYTMGNVTMNNLQKLTAIILIT